MRSATFRHCHWALCALLTAQATAFSQASQPGGNAAYTMRQFQEEELKYQRSESTDSYQRAGERDARWDGAAIKFLDEFAERCVRGDDGPDWTELQKLGKAAADAGCDDSLVLCARGVVETKRENWAAARPLFVRGIEGYSQTAHSLGLLAQSGIILRTRTPLLKLSVPESLHYRDIAFAAYLKMAAGQDAVKNNPRILFEVLDEYFGFLDDSRQAAFVRKLKDVGTADPWLLNMLEGRSHIAAAWQHRGGGWAYVVSAKGWAGFNAELAAARQCLTAAYQLHPEYPESSANMIIVAMGGGADPGQTPRFWFDRAIAAQVDWQPAYQNLLWALRPRWCGSFQEMLALGREALATRRFDTMVPAIYLDALEGICEDSGNRDIWNQPGIYEDAQKVFDGIGSDKTRPVTAAHFQACHVIEAVRQGRMNDAQRVLDEVGDRVSEAEFGYSGTTVARVAGQVYARTGPSKAKLSEAEAARNTGKFDAAISALKAALADNSDPRVAPYLQDQLGAAERERDFSMGQWVDLPLTADLAGWHPYHGKWTVGPKGAIVGASDSEGSLQLMNEARFGNRFEMEAEVELGTVHRGLLAPGGLIFGKESELGPGGWLYFVDGPSDNLLLRQSAGPDIRKYWTPVNKVNKLRLLQWDDRVTGFNNGKIVFAYQQLENVADTTGGRVGLGGDSAGETFIDHFRHVRIHKLSAPPESDEVKAFCVCEMADQMLQGGDWDGAARAIAPLTAMKLPDYLKSRFDGLTRDIPIRQKLSTGEWIDLSKTLPKSLWTTAQGGWTIEDDGSFLCKPTGVSGFMILPVQFGDLDVKAEFTSTGKPDRRMFAMLCGTPPDAIGEAIFAANPYHAVFMQHGHTTDGRSDPFDMPAGPVTLEVRVRSSHCWIYVNDQLILEADDERPIHGAIGFGGEFHEHPAPTLTVGKVMIRLEKPASQ